MPLTSHELARRSAGAIEMRREPARLRVRLADLPTADVHLVNLAFTCTMLPLDRRGEREMFAEVFLSQRDSTTADDVAAHFSPALRQAVASQISTVPAADWLGESSRPQLVQSLSDAAKRVAFACGIELLAPFELAIDSPSLEREKLEATGRKLSERRVAGQVAHVQQATELLKQFESLRQSMPNLSPGQLLERVSSAERGSMLQSLLMASATRATETLWAVSGPNLLKVDPRVTPPKVSTIPLPTDLGPLRSVQAGGDGSLLVGAQTGVLVVDPNRPADAMQLRDPQITSQLGFNSVATTGGHVWASHSEAGVVAWCTTEPDAPVKTIRDAVGARNLVALDDTRVIYTCNVGTFVEGAGSQTITPNVNDSPAAVVFIHAEGDAITLVRSSGDIECLDRRTLAPLRMLRRTGELASGGVLPWLGSTRLLLATCDGPVVCLGEDDPLVTQYTSAHRGLRAVTACADVVAALSADRQRIVLWNSWAGDAPLAEVHVAGIARHRCADICFS